MIRIAEIAATISVGAPSGIPSFVNNTDMSTASGNMIKLI